MLLDKQKKKVAQIGVGTPSVTCVYLKPKRLQELKQVQLTEIFGIPKVQHLWFYVNNVKMQFRELKLTLLVHLVESAHKKNSN